MKRTYTPPTVPLEDAEQRIIFQWAAMETAARPEVAPPRGERGLKSHLVVYYQHLQFAAYGCVERHL